MAVSKARPYLTFRVGQQWYGVGLESVHQVLHFMELDEMPATAPDVLGMMTLRDLVMPVIDLRRRFGLPQAAINLDTPIIAIWTDGGEPIGIVVDDADTVEEISDSQIVPHSGGKSRYVAAVAKLTDRLLFLLDTTAVLPEATSKGNGS